MIMSKQVQYLWIKQRLDKYNISTTFPLQTMPLLQNLLQRLEEQTLRSNNLSYENIKSSTQTLKEIELTNKLIPEALRLQISRVTQQNNQLHMDVITLKQELHSLRHCMDKLAIQKSDNRGETQRIIEFKNDVLSEIKQELSLVKFKYNELMDFIHGNDTLEKMYLKRLLNHKKFQLHDEKGSSKESQTSNRKGSERKSGNKNDLNSRITFNAKHSSSRQNDEPYHKVNLALKQNHHNKESMDRTVVYDQVSSRLKEKLIARQKEILRLQSLLTYNGPDINRILIQFNHSMQKKKHSQINQRLEFLENENQQLIKDLKNAKNNAGRCEALRNQIDISHKIIKELKEQNANIKRSLQQNNFDLHKDKKENQRSVIVLGSRNAELKLTKFNDDLKIEQLKKKVDFYQKQLGIHAKQEQNNLIKSSKKSAKAKNSQKKPKRKAVTEKRNTKQSQLERRASQEHVKLKEKDKTQKESKRKSIKNSESKQKGAKKKQIPKIPEQSQQESIQDHHQPQRIDVVSKSDNEIVNQQPDDHYKINQHEQKQQRQQSEPEESSEDEQQKNDKAGGGTLADQYLDTISELSAKCLQLKEELQTKNNVIAGLQQIVNRLIQKEQQQENHQPSKQYSQNIKGQSNQLLRLKNQVQSLSSLLNESQFQKQELRREFIQMQNLYKQLLSQGDKNTTQKIINNLKNRIKELQQIIQQKDNKIDDMREDNTQIQDKLLKSLDMVKRLNDEIQVLTKEKQGLIKEFQLNSERLDEAAELLRKQREKHESTVELNELQKDEIIMLRKNLINSQNTINDLQKYIQMLQSDQGQQNYDEEN